MQPLGNLILLTLHTVYNQYVHQPKLRRNYFKFIRCALIKKSARHDNKIVSNSYNLCRIDSFHFYDIIVELRLLFEFMHV